MAENRKSVMTQWDDEAEDFEEVVPTRTQKQHLNKEIDRVVDKVSNGKNGKKSTNK